jgi:hypothetical protein
MKRWMEDFQERFDVTWADLLVGWRGVGPRVDLVTLLDVREFGTRRVAEGSEVDADLVEVASADEKNRENIQKHLENILAREGGDLGLAEQRWVVCFLERELARLPDDPVYGQIELGEFWMDLGFPDYMPHELQTWGPLSPEEYYTEEHFAIELARHRKWIDSHTRGLGGGRG